MDFRRVSTGTPWEETVGYCRVIRAGNLIMVTGTAPIDELRRVATPEDADAQVRRGFQIIKSVCEKCFFRAAPVRKRY